MPETDMKKRDGVKPLAIVLICAVVVLTAVTGVLWLRHRAPGASRPLAPMAQERADGRTGAMMDPNREVRGLWIPTVQNITYPSSPGADAKTLKAELDTIVETARAAGLNTLCFQVRPASDAFYDSHLFPTSVYLSGKQGQAADEDFDPLAYLCEIASAAGTDGEPMAVYAWVNPLRVTAAGTDPATLSSDNPAVLHPEWTVSYGGALYYNAGLPEVRALVADGVRELCERYPIAGVIFDDYFYPYQKTDASGRILPFEDGDTYERYGGDMSLADWRRDNVNRMIRACYDAVNETGDYIQFGVAPFGIWQNDDGKNGGSATGGMNAYDTIYCDALAWIEGGYVDFIAPQIYWQFSTKVARFDTLLRWWNARCDGTGVKLWISHATYSYADWNNPGEMQNQISFARSEATYRGSLFYGYPQIRDNVLGLTEELRRAFSRDIVYYEKAQVEETPTPVSVNMPVHNSRSDSDGVYIMGQCDPDYPLLCDGEPVSRTRSGYFALYRTLKKGENTFVFTQNGYDTLHTVWKGQYAPKPEESDNVDTEGVTESETTAPARPPHVSDPYPMTVTALAGGETFSVSLRGEAGAVVTAALGDTTVTLTPGKTGKDGMCTYKGALTVPHADAGIVSAGEIRFSAVRDGLTSELQGGTVYSVGSGDALWVRVTEKCSLKVAPDSWYYDDYIPQVPGMTAQATRIVDGFAQIPLKQGETAYLDAGKLTLCASPAEQIRAEGASVTWAGEGTVIRIPVSASVPVHCTKDGAEFTVTLYGVGAVSLSETPLPENPLFAGQGSAWNAGEGVLAHTYTLKDADRYYGYTVSYESDAAVITLRDPLSFSDNLEKPLEGLRIVLDAGHGGAETGTPTPGAHLGYWEKECNLTIVYLAKARLTALGADVILLRSEDTTVPIEERMAAVDILQPDLLVSSHLNALDQTTDSTYVRGVVGIYWAEGGRTLADCISTRAAENFGYYKRATVSQRLAMLRNYGFPSALLEFCFVTCPEEFEALTAPGGFEKAADAIAEGILDWIRLQEA